MSDAPTHNAPPGVNMPKKKDPNLRRLQQAPKKEFFDSAEYEVQKHAARNDNAKQAGLRDAAMNSQHAGFTTSS